MKNETALLLIIFNRPDLTLKLYEQLKTQKPNRIYIISDGGRNDKERLIIEKSRMIFNNIDWDCEVKTNYSDYNLGLRKRIVSGIDWAFENEEKLIIIEDDCIPHPDFIPFCEEMLNKYKEHKEIMTINGCNLNHSLSRNNKETYFFSRYANSWGWATWKDAWDIFDRDLVGLKNTQLNNILKSHFTAPLRATLYWRYKLNEVEKNRINSWAFRWMFTLFNKKAYAIVPRTNLISNIGNDERSTNTKGKLHYINLPTESLKSKKITDPKQITPNDHYDRWVEDSIYSKSFKYRFTWIIQKISSGITK